LTESPECANPALSAEKGTRHSSSFKATHDEAVHEVELATNTLVEMVVPDVPQNLIGNNAYDSDKLDNALSVVAGPRGHPDQ
jgi:hypothetical protein